MEETKSESFLITDRKSLDVIEVYDSQGKKVLEVAILNTSKEKVKLGFRGPRSLKYCLLKAIDEEIH